MRGTIKPRSLILSASLSPVSELKAEEATEKVPEPAVISLGPLEKSSVDELSDGVQSMDVR